MTQNGNFLPHNLDYEKSILASIIIDVDQCRQAVEMLRAEHFDDLGQPTRHSLIFRAASDLLKNGDPVELSTVANRLHNKGQLETVGAEYLAELTYHPIATSLEHYALDIRAKKEFVVRTINWTFRHDTEHVNYNEVHKNEYVFTLESLIDWIRDTEDVAEDIISIETKTQ